jgi:hypothetical protein
MEVIMAVCRLIALNSIKNIVLYAMVLTLFSCASGSGGSSTSVTTLSWVAPAEREDGSPLALSEISGYRIYYGTESGVYLGQIYINDGSALQAQLSGIPSGTYFAVVTTVDTDGRESGYSSEVMVVL